MPESIPPYPNPPSPNTTADSEFLTLISENRETQWAEDLGRAHADLDAAEARCRDLTDALREVLAHMECPCRSTGCVTDHARALLTERDSPNIEVTATHVDNPEKGGSTERDEKCSPPCVLPRGHDNECEAGIVHERGRLIKDTPRPTERSGGGVPEHQTACLVWQVEGRGGCICSERDLEKGERTDAVEWCGLSRRQQ